MNYIFGIKLIHLDLYSKTTDCSDIKSFFEVGQYTELCKFHLILIFLEHAN